MQVYQQEIKRKKKFSSRCLAQFIYRGVRSLMCYDDMPENLTDASLKYHVHVLERFSTISSKNTFDITEKIHKVRLNIKVDNTNTNRYGCTSLKNKIIQGSHSNYTSPSLILE